MEDDCADGLALKNYLVKYLTLGDIRTFGICFGIKTRRRSEIFSSILIKRKPMFTIAGIEFFHYYDILCAEDFNSNQRTGNVFSRNNFKWLLPEQLRRAIISYYAKNDGKGEVVKQIKETLPREEKIVFLYQCPKCCTIYDSSVGEPESNIAAGTNFKDLPSGYCCMLCENKKENFILINKSSLQYVK